MQLELSGCAANRERHELGRFEQDIDGRIGNLAFDTTHDTTQRNCSLRVGNDNHFRIKLVRAVIDCDEILFVSRRPNDDASAANVGKVERMQRLTALEHDVVRSVNDVVDRLDANCKKPFLQPIRAWSDLGAANDTSNIPRARFLKLVLDDESLRG